MTENNALPNQNPAVADTGLVSIVYILYFVGYFTGITALIGVIIAHIKGGSGNALVDSHFRFQVRTFWIGLIYLIVGAVLSLVVVGWFVLIWWLLWSVVRNVKGFLALNEKRPIANPGSMMFG